MISPTSIVTPAPQSDVVFCDLAGEIALLHLQRGVYYGLDAVGARIWHLLGANQTLGEVRDTLVREFDVDEARCERDLLALLQHMADAGLVKVQSQATD